MIMDYLNRPRNLKCAMTLLKFYQKYQPRTGPPNLSSATSATPLDCTDDAHVKIRPTPLIITTTGNAHSMWLFTNRIFWARDVLENHTGAADILEQFHKASAQDKTLFATLLGDLAQHDSSATVDNLNNYWNCFPDQEMRERAIEIALSTTNYTLPQIFDYLLQRNVSRTELFPHGYTDDKNPEDAAKEVIRNERNKWQRDAHPSRGRLYERVNKLTAPQRVVFEQILKAGPGKFVLNAVGGSGKGFLIETLLLHYRLSGKTCIATGTSGRAASLLPGGITLHRAIGMNITQNLAPTENIIYHTQSPHGARRL